MQHDAQRRGTERITPFHIRMIIPPTNCSCSLGRQFSILDEREAARTLLDDMSALDYAGYAAASGLGF